MRNKRSLTACVAACSFITTSAVTKSLGTHEGELTYKLSCPASALEGRITGFKITLNAGRLENIIGIPQGWSLSINNDPSTLSTIIGDASIGAATLDCKLIRSLVFRIQKVSIGDLQFHLAASITLTKNFVNENTSKLPEPQGGK